MALFLTGFRDLPGRSVMDSLAGARLALGEHRSARYTAGMKTFRLLALAVACALPALAAAQWQWVDKDGRKVFSDQAPPASVPDSKIVKRPGAGFGGVPETAAAPAAPAPKVSGKDKELEEKKKQAEAAEAEKQKAEEEKVAAVRQENCKRFKSAKATLDSGVRIAHTNDKGEREILDDNQRAAEVRRIDDLIARDCRAQ